MRSIFSLRDCRNLLWICTFRSLWTAVDELISIQIKLKSSQKEEQVWRQQCESKRNEIQVMEERLREMSKEKANATVIGGSQNPSFLDEFPKKVCVSVRLGGELMWRHCVFVPSIRPVGSNLRR